MDVFEVIRRQFEAAVPFARHVGITIERVAPGEAEAALDQRPESSNHIGTQHAGALFTLGEAASGAAMAGTFADILTSLVPVAAEARIAYRRPAKGRIAARATTSEAAEALRARLAAEGKVRFAVDVALSDADDAEVATITVDWSVRRRRSD